MVGLCTHDVCQGGLGVVRADHHLCEWQAVVCDGANDPYRVSGQLGEATADCLRGMPFEMALASCDSGNEFVDAHGGVVCGEKSQGQRQIKGFPKVKHTDRSWTLGE